MEQYCYLNGKIVPLAEAKVGVYDIALLRGFGIYEALRTFNRKPFEFPSHMVRFHTSTEALKLQIPATDGEMLTVITELIEKNIPQGREAVVRFIITGGEAVGGIEYNPAAPTFYILVEPLEALPQETYEKGCKLLVHDHLRALPEYKTTNYVTAVRLQEERKRIGALEILYTSQGKVLECATSNFFIIKNGTIFTPRADVLAGITRKVTIELAKKEFPLEERDISVEEMYQTAEAFLTSSFKDIVPVVQVGDHTIGNGAPGPVTKRVMEIFEKYASDYGKV